MYKLKIENLRCMSCIYNINEALQENDAKAIANVDIKNKTIEVESELSIDNVIEILRDVGHPVSEILSE